MKKMSNHIEEYFAKVEGTREMFHSRELFQADDNNIDLKTDINDEEISLISTLMFNNHILKKRGLKPVFDIYINKLLRLKVSKDRKSRAEFVNINRANNPEDTLNTISNVSNILGVKK